ncbi:carboxy terminal-processing peptidase [bacterium]|nr:carboxy terminal-processing peptidase [bacterium]
MHITRHLFSTLCIFLLSSSCFFGLTKQEAQQQLLIYNALNHHYEPKSLEDTYSIDVYNYYLKRLDPSKRIFTKSNLASLSLHKYAIDDHVESNNFSFMHAANKIYLSQLDYIALFVPSLFDKPFNFETSTTLETDTDKREFPKNNDELKAYWKKIITYQALTHYINLKQADVTKNKTLSLTFNKDYEKQAREKTKKEILDTLNRLKEEPFQDRQHLYLDSLVSVFDTHSNFFPAEKKADFDINISGKLEGIGAVLREEDGFIKVVRIVPGSASWKQGELKAEDIILKVSQGKNNPSESIVGARVRDAVKLIRGKKGTPVYLTVKHPSGEIKIIPIVRDLVVIEETYTKHAVIKDKRSNLRFGYIYVPKFYRDFRNTKGRNTTDDVRKALKHLSTSNVDGILLDLRNNEGGALVDAVQTAGLFIEKGPIVQVKGRSPAVYNVLQDRDKNIHYQGPLVILINHYSASASEILAAALQDYKRAVIVGSSSFGKGTVQTFINLDHMNPAKTAMYHPLGSVKLTIQKFYRINGDSTQHKGVVPDIKFPDVADFLEVGERHLDYALKWDKLRPLNYKHWSGKITNLSPLIKQSKKRLKSSPTYASDEAYRNFIRKQSKQTRVNLDADTAIKEKIHANKISKTYNDSFTAFSELTITSPHTSRLSESLQASYKDWIKQLEKDKHIYESCSILTDLIAITKR